MLSISSRPQCVNTSTLQPRHGTLNATNLMDLSVPLPCRFSTQSTNDEENDITELHLNERKAGIYD